MTRSRLIKSQAFLTMALAGTASAQVDNLVTFVNQANSTAGKSLAAFGFDPTTDTVYTTMFGFTAPGGGAAVRQITNASNPLAQVSTGFITEAQLQLYYRDGNPDRGVSNPTASALLLNPIAINAPGGTLAPYSVAYIADAANTNLPSSSTLDPAATKRLYRWNLQAVGPAGDPPPPYGDARDVMTTVTTFADMQAAAGTVATASNFGRQFAYSGDGQSIYAMDSSTAYGGLWKINLQDHTETRLVALTDNNTEPAVISAGSVDTIYFRGGGSTGNLGGIDKITYDGTTVGARQIHLSASQLNAFMENTGTATATSFSMIADSAGNLYFNNTNSAAGLARGIFLLDTAGRLAKIVGYEERRAEFGGSPNSNTLRMQWRSATYDNGTSSFPVQQLLYAESAPISLVAGAYIFKVGDFNRDNLVDQADIADFKQNLTLRGVTLSAFNAADHPKFKYDLNGNNEVTWKDVKILQQFYTFLDGDANIDKTVNIADFAALAANFNLPAKLWTEGDFTGDESVTIADFSILAANFNQVAPSDAARSAVPEPATAAFAAMVLAMLRRTR